MSAPFLDLVDLASERLGAAVVAANDEFFAPKENLLKAARAGLARGRVHRARQMDGRLGDAPAPRSRARRARLVHRPARRARAGARRRRAHRLLHRQLSGIVRDRRDRSAGPAGGRRADAGAVARTAGASAAQAATRTICWRSTRRRRRPISGSASIPDGGVARLRVHGEVLADWDRLRRQGDVDLGAVEHGGTVVACSDMFYGSRHNLIMPGDATHMGDGWETKRRRGPGHDWTIVRLGAEGAIRRVEVDTRHFKGNAPGACSLDGLRLGERPAARGRGLARAAAADAAPAARRACLRGAAARARRRHARAAQHLSGRRHRQAAAVRAATIKKKPPRPQSSQRKTFLCGLCDLRGKTTCDWRI